MTDKPIIIDGVDVSGCPYYIHKDGNCSSHDCECVKCVHNECFYKDYKAKEQECEELKKKCNIYTCGICGNKEDCNKLYKTLTEIKEIAKVEIECKTYEIKNDCFNEIRWKALNEHIDFTKLILQKISECEVE